MDDKRLERIEQKLDDTNEHLASIDKTLTAQHVSIDYHIKRTDLVEDRLEPLEKHVAEVSGVVKFIKLLTGLAALVEIYRMFK